jgi:hypothetical protein
MTPHAITHASPAAMIHPGCQGAGTHRDNAIVTGMAAHAIHWRHGKDGFMAIIPDVR